MSTAHLTNKCGNLCKVCGEPKLYFRDSGTSPSVIYSAVTWHCNCELYPALIPYLDLARIFRFKRTDYDEDNPGFENAVRAIEDWNDE